MIGEYIVQRFKPLKLGKISRQAATCRVQMSYHEVIFLDSLFIDELCGLLKK
jgi:hypothetical protein